MDHRPDPIQYSSGSSAHGSVETLNPPADDDPALAIMNLPALAITDLASKLPTINSSSTDAPVGDSLRVPLHKKPRLADPAVCDDVSMMPDDMLLALALGQDPPSHHAGETVDSCNACTKNNIYPVQDYRDASLASSKTSEAVPSLRAPPVSNGCDEKENSKTSEQSSEASSSAPNSQSTSLNSSWMHQHLLSLSRLVGSTSGNDESVAVEEELSVRRSLRQAAAVEPSDQQGRESDPVSKSKRLAAFPWLCVPTEGHPQGSALGTDATEPTARPEVSLDAAAGGIFDDADDDDQIQLPDVASSSVEPGRVRLATLLLAAPQMAPERAIDGLLLDERRLAIRNIVTGSPSKLSAVKTSSVVPQVESGGPKTTVNEETAIIRRKPWKKKEPKGKDSSQLRILLSKRDSEQASTFLAGKGDLSDCLPPDDCLFLGDKLWIFTVEQLEFALDSDIISRLAQSSLIPLKKVPISDHSPTFTVNRQVRTAGELAQVQTPEMTERALSSTQESTTILAGASDSVTKTMEMGAPIDEINTKDPSSSPQQAVVDLHAKSTNAMDMGKTSHGMSRLPDSLQFNATEKIVSWRKAVAKFRSKENKKATPVDKRFRLEGAIKILFPMSTLNFLKSIKVETLWNFLAMKKTETGAICGLMSIWRRECSLSPIPDLGLAKHFIAIASRIETSLSAIPPIALEDRTWMRDPINVMTGAARDFLIHHLKIVSAAEFASMRTKDLSEFLEKWREEKGMEPLKGSGKVAMISAWKTSAKEASEAEADSGRVIDMSKTMSSTNIAHEKIMSYMKSPVAENVNTSKNNLKNKQSSGDRNVDYALDSKRFLADVLGGEVAKLLKHARIQTAAELFDADTKPYASALYQVLLDRGKVEGPLAFKKTVDRWRQALRQDLDQLGKKNAPDTTTSEPKVKPPPSERKADAEVPGAAQKPVKSDVDEPSLIPSRFRDENGTPDAIDSLSSVTTEFLWSIGIRTAFELLSTRSTDIAAEFKEWRIAEGKPELKGLGAIASVSGWKAMVRKRAKDLGLDRLAEVEPKTKGAWTNPNVKRVQRPKDSDESDDFLSQDNAAFETFQQGNCLEVNNRELFAVQHRELPGHFVFELSFRKRGSEASSYGKLFATYKGFGPRVASNERAQKVYVEYTAADADDTETRQPSWILADVPLTDNGATKHGNADLRSPFSALLPGCGLIDLSTHGALPFKRQDLFLIKHEIGMFVADGPGAARPETDTFFEEHHNVLVRKVAFDKFQYLLCLTKPVEKGQTFAIDFPSVTTSLNSGKYSDLEFRLMHVIDESIRTLCLEDLRDLLTWLKEHMLPSTRSSDCLDDVANSIASLKQACERRRRLYWVACRVAAAIGDRQSPGDVAACEALYFGRQTRAKDEEWNKLTEQQQEAFSCALSAHFVVEMKYAIELDRTCGTVKRWEWCSKARDLFESAVHTSAQSYISPPDSESAKWSSLAALLKDAIQPGQVSNVELLDDCILHRSSNVGNGGSEILPGQIVSGNADATGDDNPLSVLAHSHLEKDACVRVSTTSKGSSSPVMRRPNDARDGSANRSATWYRDLVWQIGATAIASLGSNLERDEANSHDHDKILASIRSIIFEDSIVKYPLPVAYQQVVCVRTLHTVGYVPSSYELFLGLVWPALRKHGWRLMAGSSPSEVSFFPRSLMRKRSSSAKPHRDRKRTKLANDVNLMGLDVDSKAMKRLLVAVINNNETAEKTIQMDAVYDRDRTVKAVLDQFRAWLINKFATGDDFSKVFASAKIFQVVRCVQNYFDICAPMLSPIPGLPPFLDEGRRPMEAYRCEYFMQILLLLPSVLRHAELSPQAINDCLDVVRDLLTFVAVHHKDIFDKRFYPPQEEYVRAGEETSVLESKIHFLLTNGEGPASDGVADSENAESTELLLEDGDRAGLTDYLVTILEQAKSIRATEEDVLRRNGRVHIGAPGIMCKHCMGGNEGRYFFSTPESLTSSYPVLEKHYRKCSKTPVDVKRRLDETRAYHTEQRTSFAHGSQQAFFTRLWRRLHNSKRGWAGGGGGLLTVAHKNGNSAAKEPSDEDLVFTDHIALLDHVRGSSKLKNKDEVQDALDSYYSCLDYAGRVYETESMPNHFSANWLLAKVLPKSSRQHQQHNVG